MTATRHTFSGFIAEVRTAIRADGIAVAHIYTVQEGSQVLQPYAPPEGADIAGNSEEEARAAALHMLRTRFGREMRRWAQVPLDSGFRVTGAARTA